MLPRTTLAAAALALLSPALLAGPASAGPAQDFVAPAQRVAAPASAAPAREVTARSGQPRVLAISIDGLNPAAIDRLGKQGTPALHRMLRQGATTLNARTEYEKTVTLPNHSGMVTSVRIDARHGGHGVTWNDDRLTPRTIEASAGRPIGSVFSVVANADRSTALFAAKTKFSLFERSWPKAISRTVIRSDNHQLTTLAIRDLVDRKRAFTFLHLSLPDTAGHRDGFMSAEYLTAVKRTDALVGRVLAAVDGHRSLREGLTVILTADHGGDGAGHSDPTKYANYRVPFLIWGPGVTADDLYDLNPDYADPGTTRPTYDAKKQPVRNGMVANLALDLLGLEPIRNSQFDTAQDLDWR